MGTHLKFLPLGTMGTRLNFLPLGTQFNLVYSITGGSMTAGTTVLRKNENALQISVLTLMAILMKRTLSNQTLKLTKTLMKKL